MTIHNYEPIQHTLQCQYQDEHLAVHPVDKTATLDAQRLALTRKEYDLLTLLVANAGEVVPREALLMGVWGYSSAIRTRTLDVHILKLRKHLGGYSERYIETIFGVGYRFQPYRAIRHFQSFLSAADLERMGRELGLL